MKKHIDITIGRKEEKIKNRSNNGTQKENE
jgi:hypothetical protein